MNTDPFTYIPINPGEPMLIHLIRDGEFKVIIGGSHQGSVVQDDSAEFGWRTEDPLLLEVLPDLSMVLREREAMGNLPYALKEMYPAEIIAWEWTEDGQLKIITRPETDLKAFADMVRDQVNEVVLFEKDLIIYLFKEAGSGVKEIHINC
ncbi:hypothetical protein [Pedobacter psychrodurus]|uniref:hypothetical protein n=1 Tax=Pedobacter psychrodurus TaxID=2530456 RepID=UPI00292E8FD7|nr:hypothetical protein [Pedobacter psychrodurus]